MPIRKLIREQAFKLARRDVAAFLEDHERDLLRIFREEMQNLDDEIPEESFFIDIMIDFFNFYIYRVMMTRENLFRKNLKTLLLLLCQRYGSG